MKKILLFSVLSFSIGMGAKGQATLDSVEVTSTRTIQNITKTGRNVQVITASDIAKMPVNSADEILRFLPGVEMQSRGAFGVQSDFSLRGSTYNQVLVLVDGVRINDPLTGHFNGYIPVPLAEIERIEVLKGTASAIYGADAVGGVVNIITKTTPTTKNSDVIVNVKAGENAYFGTDASILTKVNDWKFSVGVQTNKSDGQQFENPNFGSVASAPENFNTWFDNQTFSAHIGRKINKNWKVGIRSSYDERDFAAKYFYTISAYDESVEKTTIFFNNLKVSQESEKFKTDIDLAYRRSTDYFAFNPAFPPNEHTTQFAMLQVNQSFRAAEHHTFVYGIQLDGRSIESSDRGNHENIHFGGYVQWIGNFIEHLTTTASLRADYDDSFDLVWSPQVNASYVWNKVVFRGGLGKGIRAADYTERYVSNNLPALSPGRNLGNPDLVEESSWSYELGMDYFITPNLKWVTTGFYRASDNLIDYVSTPGYLIQNVPVALDSAGSYLYSKNIATVNTVGIESELWWSKNINKDLALDLRVGYTGLQSTNPNGEVSKYVSSHAKHLINGGLNLSIRQLKLGVTSLYKFRDTAYSQTNGVVIPESYLVTNATISYSFLDNKLNANVEVLNVFDELYSDILGAPMPGRWIMAGIGLKL